MTGHGREENGSQLGLQLGHLCDPPKTVVVAAAFN
jgi:hypothetical protein